MESHINNRSLEVEQSQDLLAVINVPNLDRFVEFEAPIEVQDLNQALEAEQDYDELPIVTDEQLRTIERAGIDSSRALTMVSSPDGKYTGTVVDFFEQCTAMANLKSPKLQSDFVEYGTEVFKKANPEASQEDRRGKSFKTEKGEVVSFLKDKNTGDLTRVVVSKEQYAERHESQQDHNSVSKNNTDTINKDNTPNIKSLLVGAVNVKAPDVVIKEPYSIMPQGEAASELNAEFKNVPLRIQPEMTEVWPEEELVPDVDSIKKVELYTTGSEDVVTIERIADLPRQDPAVSNNLGLNDLALLSDEVLPHKQITADEVEGSVIYDKAGTAVQGKAFMENEIAHEGDVATEDKAVILENAQMDYTDELQLFDFRSADYGSAEVSNENRAPIIFDTNFDTKTGLKNAPLIILQEAAVGIWVISDDASRAEPFSAVGVFVLESGEVGRDIMVGSSDLTQQLLVLPLESVSQNENNGELETVSRSERVFEQLITQIEVTGMPDEVREEGAALIESMYDTTQQIQETALSLQVEIAYLAEAQTLPPELSRVILSEKTIDIQQIIEVFAIIDENKLPKGVVKIYRELLEKVVMLQKMSEQFGGLFMVAYDPVTHSLKLIPKKADNEDPMHEMYDTFGQSLIGISDDTGSLLRRALGSVSLSKSDFALAA